MELLRVLAGARIQQHHETLFLKKPPTLCEDRPVNVLIFLTVFPLCVAVLAALLPVGLHALRKTIGIIAAVVMSALSVYLLIAYHDAGPLYFTFDSPMVDWCMFGVELFIAVFVVVFSIRHKRYLPVVLVVLQSVIM